MSAQAIHHRVPGTKNRSRALSHRRGCLVSAIKRNPQQTALYTYFPNEPATTQRQRHARSRTYRAQDVTHGRVPICEWNRRHRQLFEIVKFRSGRVTLRSAWKLCRSLPVKSPFKKHNHTRISASECSRRNKTLVTGGSCNWRYSWKRFESYKSGKLRTRTLSI